MEILQGKTAVVTGASSGIGLAIARLFAHEGAVTFMTGRRPVELATAAASIPGAFFVPGDVTDSRDLDELYSVVKAEAGGIDVLVANAGGRELRLLQDIDYGHYERTFDANVKGVLFTVQKAVPLLRNGASIVLVGSTAGSTGSPAFSVYNASKAAVRGLARSWANELAPHSIRVNVLSSGNPSSDGRAVVIGDERNLVLQRLTQGAGSGRLTALDKVAAAALFLASEESDSLTGTELFAEGGVAQA